MLMDMHVMLQGKPKKWPASGGLLAASQETFRGPPTDCEPHLRILIYISGEPGSASVDRHSCYRKGYREDWSPQ